MTQIIGSREETKKEKTEGAFVILGEDPASQARAGLLRTAHGEVETPCFMPCGTQGTVKALSSEELEEAGAQIILSNAYHLYLRPGEEVFEATGSLHSFMRWKGAILTDSGGFQVFSLSPLRRVTDEGLSFQSHIDGSKQFLTPERIVQFQLLLGSDIVMVLDECVGYPSLLEASAKAMERTLGWARRSKEAFQAGKTQGRFLFGIVQGGTDSNLRRQCGERLLEIGFDGYAIGGLGVGEPAPLLWEQCALSTGQLPKDRPRYLMGVGTPEDLLEGISLGIDFFDCVLPTRHGRNAQVFTGEGIRNLRNAAYAKDPEPIERECPCPACRGYSRAYLHHLLKSKEILGVRLATLHNIWFYLGLMKASREAIRKKNFEPFKKGTLTRLRRTS